MLSGRYDPRLGEYKIIAVQLVGSIVYLIFNKVSTVGINLIRWRK